ncbi:hypothetical protein BD560DRAFT_328181, partial [Blakeslea trispora]
MALPLDPPASSDFSQYLLQERAKSVPMAKYDLTSSIRIWLRQFHQQAQIHGIVNMDICTVHLAQYMPNVIQQWIPTLAPTIVSSWTLLTESLITRFGILEEEDNRRLLKQLKE